MDPVAKAVWCVESRFASGISLDEIAEVGGVSRFHLCRAFGVATGRSVMRYVRERRLTEAARKLADGAPDILSSRSTGATARTRHSPAPSAISSASRRSNCATGAISKA